MTKPDQASYGGGMGQALKGTISRAQLLATAGAGLALAAVPGGVSAASTSTGSGRMEFPFSPQVKGNYTPENIQDILNVLDTVETFFVSVTMFGLTGIGSPVPEPVLSYRRARAVIGQLHIDYLESLGAHSLLTTFTPRNKPTATSVGESDAALVIGAYMTAVREFAELGQPLLAKNAFQAGAMWAELRAYGRVLSGATPALNKVFETDHWVYTRDYYKFYVEGTQFENSGVSRSGLRLNYPGRDAVLAAAGPMASAILQKTPNNAIVSTTGADVRRRGEAAALLGERGDTP